MRMRLPAALLLSLGVVWFCSSTGCGPRIPRYTEDTARRIQLGMTEPEVIAILGRPAGNYTSGPRMMPESHLPDFWFSPKGTPLGSGVTSKGWVDDQGYVAAHFDKNGRVIRRWWGKVVNTSP